MVFVNLFTKGDTHIHTHSYYLPLFRDILVLPFPPGLEVGRKLKPEHEEIASCHLRLPRLRHYPKVQDQVLETENKYLKKSRSKFYFILVFVSPLI